MSDSLYGDHSRSPTRPSFPGHPYPEEKNQCDGCAAGKPVNAKGFHRMAPEGAEYPDYMACQKGKYLPGK